MIKKKPVPKEVAAFFSKCGRTSASNMSPEDRKERARKAAMTRWEKKKEEKNNSLETQV